jgi:polysaccharide biosynthesis protein PslF
MTIFGMISPYPPTQCGLADYANRLRTGLLANQAEEVRIARIGEAPHDGEPAEVVACLADGEAGGKQAAAALNECDVAIVQHEFGSYSEADWHSVLRVADMLSTPTIAALHAVPAAPTVYQRGLLEMLVDRVNATTVTSEAEADRLMTGYAVDAAKIAVIPHEAGVAHQAELSSTTNPDWAAVCAGYGRLASLLQAEQGRLLV